MVLRAYSCLLSQPGRAVPTFLRAANTEHEFTLVGLRKGVHKKPEYLPILWTCPCHLYESHNRRRWLIDVYIGIMGIQEGKFGGFSLL